MNPEEFKDEFFRAYRGRYSSYWVERWGLIPSIPTSFDNANSIYELLAWLQRAFKQLLDDFVALESELEDYKNALTELLEQLIPLLIRRYMESKEADDWFNKKADIYYNKIIKPYIDAEIAKVNKKIAELEKKVDDEVKRLDGRIDALNDKLEKEIKKLDDRITKEIAKLNERITAENNALKERIEALENANAGLQNALRKIIENLGATSQQVILTCLVVRQTVTALSERITEAQKTTCQEVSNAFRNTIFNLYHSQR